MLWGLKGLGVDGGFSLKKKKLGTPKQEQKSSHAGKAGNLISFQLHSISGPTSCSMKGDGGCTHKDSLNHNARKTIAGSSRVWIGCWAHAGFPVAPAAQRPSGRLA